MAATTRTPAASIRISAISKPGITRAFDMVPSLQIVTMSFHFGASISQRGQIVQKSLNRAHSRKRPAILQTHEMQRPKICPRVGSATRLNDGSHPTGGCGLATKAGNETGEVRFSGNRSALFARLTETVCCAVFAAPGVLTIAGKAPAIRPTDIATTTTLLSFPSISASSLWRRVGCSGQMVPLYVGQFQQ